MKSWDFYFYLLMPSWAIKNITLNIQWISMFSNVEMEYDNLKMLQ